VSKRNLFNEVAEGFAELKGEREMSDKTCGTPGNDCICGMCPPQFFSGVSPRGNLIPQTVESLQNIMERDAITIEELAKEITQLKLRNEKLDKKIAQLKSARTTQRALAHGVGR